MHHSSTRYSKVARRNTMQLLANHSGQSANKTERQPAIVRKWSFLHRHYTRKRNNQNKLKRTNKRTHGSEKARWREKLYDKERER